MRTKLFMVILIIAAMTGTAVASFPDELTASWTGSQIKSDAWDFKMKNDGTPFWYQIFYYPPGTYSPSSTGYRTPYPAFLGIADYDSDHHYVEYFHPDEVGEWTVVLKKGGVEGSTPDVVSIRVVTTVAVPGAISLIKTADPTKYRTAGDIITYTYEITNTGIVALSGQFTVTDDKLGVIDCGSVSSLAIGAKAYCTETYTILDTDLDKVSIINHATATLNGATSSSEATVIHSIRDPGPGTEIPEFPTVALPVAAVIGIMFFMQRRKMKE